MVVCREPPTPPVTLAHEVRGRGPRVVLVHGFAQNRRCWGDLAERLAADHEVVLIDAPGHGDSGHDDADLDEAAALIADIGGRSAYLGYSMGARMVLHLIVARPELVTNAVLIGVHPGLTDADQRRRRVEVDHQRAADLESRGLDAFLDDWMAMPMFADLDERHHHRAARATNRPEGLAASLRRCGTGTQRPLAPELADSKVQARLAVGEHDTRFRAIASELAAGWPTATVDVIDGVGHAAHLRGPAAVADLVDQPPAIA